MTISSIILSQGHTSKQMQKVKRENIEWCDTWIPYARKTDKPRILLIGDSIMRGYYNPVCKLLSEKAYCAKFATSACLADPVFYLQLRTMFSQYKYSQSYTSTMVFMDLDIQRKNIKPDMKKF